MNGFAHRVYRFVRLSLVLPAMRRTPLPSFSRARGLTRTAMPTRRREALCTRRCQQATKKSACAGFEKLPADHGNDGDNLQERRPR